MPPVLKANQQRSFLWRTILLPISAALLVSTAPRGEAQEERAADHEALRELRRVFTEAVNRRDFDSLRPLLTDSFVFTTIDNRKLSGIEEMERYWNTMFEGEQAVLESMTVNPEPDGLTEFLGEKVGVAHGTSHDVYAFKKVGRREMTSRWTALVWKADEGWLVDRVHMSGNILDNPVLDAQTALGNLKGGAALALGLVGGLVLGAFLFRRKRRA